MKNTKIITTIGPASHSEEGIKGLFENGMTTVRMNFSHGDFAEQQERVDWARKISKDLKKPISLMLDTKGPEIRVFEMEGGAATVNTNDKVEIITDQKIPGTANRFSVYDSTGHYDMSKDVRKDMWILVDDGKLRLHVDHVSPGKISTTALNQHVVKTNKRLNIPGAHYTMPFMSAKDKKDIIEFGVKNNVDYIAASFANKPEHILEIKDILRKHNALNIRVVAKIETQQACDNIAEIVRVSDGIMVARGDLGLEIPYYDVPVWQKKIVKECRAQGKPVIIATQMLDSMEKSPAPTRAEVTDVYYACELGADSTMLSGESAAGQFPFLACATMAKINHKAESVFNYSSSINRAIRKGALQPEYAELIKQATELVYTHNDYVAIVVNSNDKDLYRSFATIHPRTPVLGITSDQILFTAFGISYGVYMHLASDFNVNHVKELLHHNHLPAGKVVVIDNNQLKTINITK